MVREACGTTVTIQREPRRVPVTHRRFDVTEFNIAFPEHKWISLESGIADMVRHYMGKDSVKAEICHR
jgi:hypothetical protein